MYEYSVQWSLYETGKLWIDKWFDDKIIAEELYEAMKSNSGWRRVQLVRRRKPGPVEVIWDD